MLHSVIMAGGSGTRFWPQSRKAMPKQLLRLAGERTMIQETAARCSAVTPADRTWIVTNQVQVAETQRQLPDVPCENVIVEPIGRDTAPCIGLAAIKLLRQDPEAVMFVMPADHVIQPIEVFQDAMRDAERLVREDPTRLVLFGIPPTFAATGYGYIERGDSLHDDPATAFIVQSFREKPERSVAEKYVRSGTYYWNCGIFCWSAKTIVEAIKRHEPEVYRHLTEIADVMETPEEDSALSRVFPQIKAISIDYAVLERADNVVVVEAPFEWDDVGSWLAVPRLQGTDDAGNTVDGPHCGLNTKNCVVRTTDDHLVATLGMEDCIVVHTPDATLVARRDESESIKTLLKELGNANYEHVL